MKEKHFFQEYNAIPDDIRLDEETQTEIHQTVDDLRERLWNICDEQKQQAESECQAIMNNGWYEDRLGKLCNNYLTLMQVEILFLNSFYLRRQQMGEEGIFYQVTNHESILFK